MNFRNLIVIFFLLAASSALKAQKNAIDPAPEVVPHHLFVGTGYTPISTTSIQTFSFELGYSLTRKLQVMAGPSFFMTNYERYSSYSNLFCSLYGGFAGARLWWRGIPPKGWAYFSTTELHLAMPSNGGGGFRPASTHHFLNPEIGNGFGRFSPGGFYFLFNFNFGFEIPVKTNVGGEVYTKLKLAAGFRI